MRRQKNPFNVVDSRYKSIGSFRTYDEAYEAADSLNAKAGENKYHVLGILRTTTEMDEADRRSRDLPRYGSAAETPVKRGRGRPRKIVANPFDKDAAIELYYYIDSDPIFGKRLDSIHKNLILKQAKGVYKSALAPQAFAALVSFAAKRYQQEAGSAIDFSAQTRRLTAKELAERFESEAEAGNYNVYLPKKYAKNPTVKPKEAEALAALRRRLTTFGELPLEAFSTAEQRLIRKYPQEFDFNVFSSYVSLKTKTAKNSGSASNFDAAIDKISQMFQGRRKKAIRRVPASDLQPNSTARLGQLKRLVVKNPEQGRLHITFNGDALLSADRRKNLHISGKDAILSNVALPKGRELLPLGQLMRIHYVTDKKHIGNGELTEYYHDFGEVNKQKPNVFVDSAGFIHIIGGDYDIWKEGIVN